MIYLMIYLMMILIKVLTGEIHAIGREGKRSCLGKLISENRVGAVKK